MWSKMNEEWELEVLGTEGPGFWELEESNELSWRRETAVFLHHFIFHVNFPSIFLIIIFISSSFSAPVGSTRSFSNCFRKMAMCWSVWSGEFRQRCSRVRSISTNSFRRWTDPGFRIASRISRLFGFGSKNVEISKNWVCHRVQNPRKNPSELQYLEIKAFVVKFFRDL